MTKFVKLSTVAREVAEIVTTRIEEANSFPQVYFIPELLYKAVMNLHDGDKDLAFKFTQGHSRLHGFSLIGSELTDVMERLSESMYQENGPAGNLEIAISEDALLVPFMLDGQLFKSSLLRTITVFEVPKYKEGDYFGILPTPLNLDDEDEEEVENDIRLHMYSKKGIHKKPDTGNSSKKRKVPDHLKQDPNSSTLKLVPRK